MRFVIFCLLLFSCTASYAQRDTFVNKPVNPTAFYQYPRAVRDSAAMAIAIRQQFISDSIGMFYFKPDSLREDQFLAKVKKSGLFSLNIFPGDSAKIKGILYAGHVRESRDPWIIGAILGLLIYTALLNVLLGKDITSVIQTLYNRRTFSPVDKEGGLIHTWAFIGLFILFSLTSGLVLSQLTVYYHVYYTISGFQLFISLSVVISLLFAFKFFLLKFIGFVFDINRYVSQYITILNLTYFNVAFVLLFVSLCFSLLSSQFIPYLKAFTVVAIGFIFAWQYLRNSVNIISHFRFHKFYLFIYLCALEICPVLILIKALNI
jgi:hypothetical protein